MDTLRLDDGSRPARKRIRTISGDDVRTPTVERDENRVPSVDWTGHRYKAPSQCRVLNYNHRGREAVIPS